jgi:hypothetical protein
VPEGSCGEVEMRIEENKVMKILFKRRVEARCKEESE